MEPMQAMEAMEPVEAAKKRALLGMDRREWAEVPEEAG